MTTRDQIVDIKGSRAFPALLHKVQACNGDGEVAYSRRRDDIERSGATGVSLFPRLSHAALLALCLPRDEGRRHVEATTRTNVGHVSAFTYVERGE